MKSFILYLFILGSFNNFLPKSIRSNALKVSTSPTVEYIYRTTVKNEIVANQTGNKLNLCKSNFSCELDLISTFIGLHQLANFELISLFGLHFVYSLSGSKALGHSKEFSIQKLKKLLNFYSGLISKKSDYRISTLVLGFNPISSLEISSLTLLKNEINQKLGYKFERKKANFMDSY